MYTTNPKLHLKTNGHKLNSLPLHYLQINCFAVNRGTNSRAQFSNSNQRSLILALKQSRVLAGLRISQKKTPKDKGRSMGQSFVTFLIWCKCSAGIRKDVI